MQPNHPDTRAAPDAEDHPGGVAARCFMLAEQIGGGPVHDALVAMGQDYSARARAAAQTAGFRIELAHNSRDRARFWPLRLFAELLAPLPPLPARRDAPAARPAAQPQSQRSAQPQARRAAPVNAPSAPTKRSQRASRMFRMHALARIES
jgi:hypothetical protein